MLVLTLYLTASLPSVKEVCYRAVPASRRDRVRFLSEEITRRVGGYVIGQVAIASTNAICTYILLRILGLPYPEALAVRGRHPRPDPDDRRHAWARSSSSWSRCSARSRRR